MALIKPLQVCLIQLQEQRRKLYLTVVMGPDSGRPFSRVVVTGTSHFVSWPQITSGPKQHVCRVKKDTELSLSLSPIYTHFYTSFLNYCCAKSSIFVSSTTDFALSQVTERERERDTDRQTDRQTDRETDRDRERQREKKKKAKK